MRNKFEASCHYCGTVCEPGTADIWKTRGGWRASCDSCKATRPEQIEGAKKHKERLEKAKKAKAEKAAPKKLSPASMTKKELLAIVESLMAAQK